MNINPKEILKLIRTKASGPMKIKELAQLLGVRRPDVREFRAVIKELVQSGDLVQLKRNRVGLSTELNVLVGVISVNRSGTGFVPRENEQDIMIPRSDLGTAFDGDQVMIRIGGFRGDRRIGAVIRVMERNPRKIVGVFHRDRHFNVVTADNPRVHRDIYIPDEFTLDAADGEKVVAELVVWDDPYLHPEGRILEHLGHPGDPGVDMLTVIKSFDLPEEFSEKVQVEAEKAAVMPDRLQLTDRTDFTAEDIYTIDPADAKDFDDAVSVIKTAEGYRLGVHIADVSYFVQPGTALDTEAFERGNSVYLPGMVIPMLPETLSNDVCSLKPNRLRLAHSIIIDFDDKGKMFSWQLHDSLIKSRARLAYEDVQAFFDGEKTSARVERIAENLTTARELARILSRRRLQSGSLDFDLPESKIVLNEKGEVLQLGSRVRLEAHRLVEEFMLAANRAVALEVFRKAQPFLYRVHDRPSLERMEEFSHMMTRLGYHFPVSPELKPIHFARFLDTVKDKPEVEFINELMLRSMQKAVYQPENIGHFGLSFRHYTHFTSPIRRYPDLLVHRMLRKLRNVNTYPTEYGKRIESVIKNVGTHCSETERIAERAERQAVRIKQVAFMARHVGDEYDGVIAGVTSYGFFVRLNDLGAEGVVRISSLEDDYYTYEEKQYRFVGRRTGKIYRLGDAVKVGVLRVDQVGNAIELTVVGHDKALSRSDKNRKTRRSRKAKGPRKTNKAGMKTTTGHKKKPSKPKAHSKKTKVKPRKKKR